MNHDPLCPKNQTPINRSSLDDYYGRYNCQCELVARVREDERMQEYNRPFDQVSMLWHKRGYAAALRDAPNCVCKFQRGYAAALRDAVEAVKASMPEEDEGWEKSIAVAWMRHAVAAIEALERQQAAVELTRMAQEDGLL